MTEEEKEAIEKLEELSHYCALKSIDKYKDNRVFAEFVVAIQKVENLIQKQQSEFEDLKLKYEQNLKMCKHFRAELNKQINIIDLMSTEIYLKEPLKYTSIEEVEKDYERKVEND